MFHTGKGPRNSETPAQRGKYFKLQISGWTDFDPMDKELSEIADAIEQGGGFLSAIEVVEVENDLAAIKDTEVREGFQNILAARRILRSLSDLPKKVVEELRSALRDQEEVDERKRPRSAESQPDWIFKQGLK
jgi:hypothetical protein